MTLAIFFLLLAVMSQASGRNVGNNIPIRFEDNPRTDNPRSDDPRHVIPRRQITPISTMEIDDSLDILGANKGILSNLKEGDIQQNSNSRNTLDDVYSDVFWNMTKVPIVYGSDVTLLTKAAVDEARREYELRTCLSFPDRTDEEDYLEIRVLGGCWSYVGIQGGAQTVSIGVGCEQMSTIIHEFMHAIGVWHEQSRADRDDYIQINYDAVNADLAYNFDNYNLNETDDRRVPYDFDSVMHYGKYAFTDDGNITIQTRDPAFEDVIGQRSGFSEGDVTKIDRMYGCSDTVRITNSVNFEAANAGGYSQAGLDSDVDWIKHNLETSHTTGPTTKYLPKFDSTSGVEGKGSFMYLDTSGRIPGLSGAMKSMRYKTTVDHQCLEYSYFMKLNSGSTATMYIYLAEIDDVTGEIISYGSPIRTHNSHTSSLDVWWVERMTISAPSSYKIVFWAKTGAYYSDIMAIDDVTIVDKECDTSFFQAVDYSNLMMSYELDQYFVSPVMYTGNPGYAYQLLSPNQAIGWRAFMNNNLLATRMYLKRGVAYFSVQVTDMRQYNSTESISAKLSNPVLRQTPDDFEKTYVRTFNSELPEEPESPNYEHQSHDGMMSVGMAALLILVTSGTVFIVMAIVVCVVARSYLSRSKTTPYPRNDFGNVNRFALDTPKKYDNEHIL